jgi:hypothetical protein
MNMVALSFSLSLCPFPQFVQYSSSDLPRATCLIRSHAQSFYRDSCRFVCSIKHLSRSNMLAQRLSSKYVNLLALVIQSLEKVVLPHSFVTTFHSFWNIFSNNMLSVTFLKSFSALNFPDFLVYGPRV